MKKVAFVGSKAMGLRILEAMHSLAPEALSAAITIDDSRDIRSTLDKFQEFARRTGKPLKVLKRQSDLKYEIATFQPDLCIVVGWYWVLNSELLAMVPDGWLGMHASLLPKYRGGAPLVWAILNGEKETGVSLFYFDQGVDTGDIVAQRRVPIEVNDTIAQVLVKVEMQSVEMLQDHYSGLLQGKVERMRQDNKQASYCALRNPTDGQIDWRQSASRLYNFVRGQTHPYPGAFCYLGEKKIRIWSAKPFDFPFLGPEGQIVMVAEGFVVVTCGEGTALCLENIQVEGSSEMPAPEILKFGQRLN